MQRLPPVGPLQESLIAVDERSVEPMEYFEEESLVTCEKKMSVAVAFVTVVWI